MNVMEFGVKETEEKPEQKVAVVFATEEENELQKPFNELTTYENLMKFY